MHSSVGASWWGRDGLFDLVVLKPRKEAGRTCRQAAGHRTKVGREIAELLRTTPGVREGVPNSLFEKLHLTGMEISIQHAVPAHLTVYEFSIS